MFVPYGPLKNEDYLRRVENKICYIVNEFKCVREVYVYVFIFYLFFNVMYHLSQQVQSQTPLFLCPEHLGLLQLP